jgi:hypothetical protein
MYAGHALECELTKRFEVHGPVRAAQARGRLLTEIIESPGHSGYLTFSMLRGKQDCLSASNTNLSACEAFAHQSLIAYLTQGYYQ